MAQMTDFKSKGEPGYLETPATPDILNGNFHAILEALGLNKDTYDKTSIYKIDDIVSMKYKLYSCTVEITNPEEFNIEHWKECPIFIDKNINPKLFKISEEKRKLVWTNDNQINTFGPQTIELNFKGVTHYKIYFYRSSFNNKPNDLSSIDLLLDVPGALMSNFPSSGGSMVAYRNVKIEGNNIIFSGGFKTTGTSAQVADNSVNIPYKIYTYYD